MEKFSTQPINYPYQNSITVTSSDYITTTRPTFSRFDYYFQQAMSLEGFMKAGKHYYPYSTKTFTLDDMSYPGRYFVVCDVGGYSGSWGILSTQNNDEVMMHEESGTYVWTPLNCSLEYPYIYKM